MWDRFSGNGGSKIASRGLRAVEDLTAAVIASLSDHVAIVDGAGNIIAVNKAWKSFDCTCGDFGLQRSGIGSNYLEVCEAAERAGAGGVEGAVLGLRAVLEGSKRQFSLIYVCHSGSGRQWFRMSATPIGLPPDGAVISHVSVGEPPPAGDAPLTATTTPAETGESLLRVLTENLAKTIGARFVFLSEVVEQRAGRVRLIALWTGDGFEENFEYDVDGTPCRDVLGGDLCLYPADVQKSFPDDGWLKEIAAECYLAVPLFSSAGEVIGHVGVIHDQSLDDLALAEQVLRAVGAQASVELERMRLVRTLQKSERTARALLNAPTDSALLLEPDGTITDLNEVAAIRLNLSVEEAVGRNVFDLFPPELAATRRAAMDKVMTSRKPLLMEDERGGMHFESSVHPVLDPQGDVESVAIFASNVTARKAAEEKLAKNERRMRQVTEHIGEMVWLSDPDEGRLLYVNPAYEEIWGRSCQSLYDDPRSWLKAVHPDDLERVKAALGKPEEVFDQEYRIVRPDGSVRWIWDRSFPIREKADGRPRKAGITVDTTDRKQAEEQLRESEERFRSLVESSNEGIITTDRDGRIELANSATERMFGYGPGELGGQGIETLVPERHRDEHVGHRTGYNSDPQSRPMGKEMALVGRRKDGTEFPVEVSLSPLEGLYQGQVMATISDITERKQAAEAVRQSAERNASLINAIPDMMFTLDRQGVYVDFVPADGPEPYVPADQFLGRTAFEVLPTALAQRVMQGVELALKTGQQQQLAYELELDDGRHEYEARILKSKEDEALAIVRDVTAAKRLEREEQLRRERDKLEGTVEKEMLGKNPYGLTFREFTVLHLAADGEADKAIADQLGISTFTVSKHVANILGKMAAASRTEACVRALREGLLI